MFQKSLSFFEFFLPPECPKPMNTCYQVLLGLLPAAFFVGVGVFIFQLVRKQQPIMDVQVAKQDFDKEIVFAV